MGQVVCCQDDRRGGGTFTEVVQEPVEPEKQAAKSLPAPDEVTPVEPQAPPEPAPQEQPAQPEPAAEEKPAAPPQPEPAPEQQPAQQETAAPAVEEPKAVVEEQPPVAEQSVVTIDFEVDGQTRTVKAVKKPLGLEFQTATKPLTVACVKEGSHGAELGIQTGWKLIAIGSGSSRDTLSNQETVAAMNVFRRHVAQLPNLSGSVNLCFNANGDDKVVTVSRGPLGLTFERTAPITVYTVKQGTHADKLGINVGWILKTVGDEDVSTLSFEKATEVFQRSVNGLPRD